MPLMKSKHYIIQLNIDLKSHDMDKPTISHLIKAIKSKKQLIQSISLKCCFIGSLIFRINPSNDIKYTLDYIDQIVNLMEVKSYYDMDQIIKYNSQIMKHNSKLNVILALDLSTLVENREMIYTINRHVMNNMHIKSKKLYVDLIVSNDYYIQNEIASTKIINDMNIQTCKLLSIQHENSNNTKFLDINSLKNNLKNLILINTLKNQINIDQLKNLRNLRYLTLIIDATLSNVIHQYLQSILHILQKLKLYSLQILTSAEPFRVNHRSIEYINNEDNNNNNNDVDGIGNTDLISIDDDTNSMDNNEVNLMNNVDDFYNKVDEMNNMNLLNISTAFIEKFFRMVLKMESLTALCIDLDTIHILKSLSVSDIKRFHRFREIKLRNIYIYNLFNNPKPNYKQFHHHLRNSHHGYDNLIYENLQELFLCYGNDIDYHIDITDFIEGLIGFLNKTPNLKRLLLYLPPKHIHLELFKKLMSTIQKLKNLENIHLPYYTNISIYGQTNPFNNYTHHHNTIPSDSNNIETIDLDSHSDLNENLTYMNLETNNIDKDFGQKIKENIGNDNNNNKIIIPIRSSSNIMDNIDDYQRFIEVLKAYNKFPQTLTNISLLLNIQIMNNHYHNTNHVLKLLPYIEKLIDNFRIKYTKLTSLSIFLDQYGASHEFSTLITRKFYQFEKLIIMFSQSNQT